MLCLFGHILISSSRSSKIIYMFSFLLMETCMALFVGFQMECCCCPRWSKGSSHHPTSASQVAGPIGAYHCTGSFNQWPSLFILCAVYLYVSLAGLWLRPDTNCVNVRSVIVGQVSNTLTHLITVMTTQWLEKKDLDPVVVKICVQVAITDSGLFPTHLRGHTLLITVSLQEIIPNIFGRRRQ
jgi:hypothetical protein